MTNRSLYRLGIVLTLLNALIAFINMMAQHWWLVVINVFCGVAAMYCLFVLRRLR